MRSPGNLQVTGSYAEECAATREVLNLVGGKWSVMVVVALGEGPVRFNELRRRVVGISQRVLTQTLRGLEREGLVLRTVIPTVPPGVDYALTPLGRSLFGPIVGLVTWANSNRGEVEAARSAFDSRKSE